MTDKNFELACELADDLYFKFIDSLHNDIANEYVVADEDNIGSTKNTDKGSDLYWQIEDTIKQTLDKQGEQMTIIKCNNCETLYEEDDINIVECLYCKSDEYLTESEEIK